MFKHKLVLGSYYYVFLSILVYMIPFLSSKGMDSITIGFLNSAGLFGLVISFLLVGVITDFIKSNKKILVINLSISIVALMLMMVTTNLIFLGILYLIVWATFMSVTPIVDGLILKDAGEVNYSNVRSIGSVGAALSYLCGSLYMSYAPKFLPYSEDSSFYVNSLLVIDIILIVVILIILKNINEHIIKDNFNYKEGFKHIFKSRNLILIILITALTYGVLAADDAYSYRYSIEVVNIGLVTFGIVGFLSIALEAVLLNFYKSIEEKFSFKNIMFFISLILIVIFYTKANYYTYPNIIIAGNVIMGVFTGLFIPLSVILIDLNTDHSVKNTVLAIYQMANKLGGAVLGLITTTYVLKTDSLPGIYNLHMLIVVSSLLLIVFLKSERK